MKVQDSMGTGRAHKYLTGLKSRVDLWIVRTAGLRRRTPSLRPVHARLEALRARWSWVRVLRISHGLWQHLRRPGIAARLEALRARWSWVRVRRISHGLWQHLRRPGIAARLAIAFLVVALLAVAANLIVAHGRAI